MGRDGRGTRRRNEASASCESGGIGRRAGLRIRCLRTCGFKPRLSHRRLFIGLLASTSAPLSWAPRPRVPGPCPAWAKAKSRLPRLTQSAACALSWPIKPLESPKIEREADGRRQKPAFDMRLDPQTIALERVVNARGALARFGDLDERRAIPRIVNVDLASIGRAAALGIAAAYRSAIAPRIVIIDP